MRADAGDDRLLARAGVDAAEDLVLSMEPGDALFERTDQLHPVVELEFLFDSRRGLCCGALGLRHRRQSPKRLWLPLPEYRSAREGNKLPVGRNQHAGKTGPRSRIIY